MARAHVLADTPGGTVEHCRKNSSRSHTLSLRVKEFWGGPYASHRIRV
jgi:hypothetical protein